MKIYNYDLITFIYTGSQNADLDPEETKRQSKNVYLIPANATTIKPPAAQTDKARVWQENQWVFVADYRANYYKVDEGLDVYDITEIGELPEGFILVTKELGDLIKANPDDYIIDGDIVREKTDEEKEAEEKERIGNLQCTKRVFVLMLEQLGLDYFEQIEPVINSNRDAKLQWELCVQLERKNPLLDLLAAQFGVTPKQLDDLFKFANGEITQEEFTGGI